MMRLSASLVLLALTSGASAQAVIDRYLTGTLSYTDIVTSANQVSQPRDLEFKPNTNELWVLNKGASGGGTHVIVHRAGLSGQTSEFRKDSHSGHFMIYPSAMAWSDNGEWANVSEIQNTASPTSTFMGPALWKGDLDIYAEVFQNNWVSGYPLGSHIDMLHQSPFGMGIAADSAKVYWVMDGHFGNIVRYDFVADHGPGYDDHSAGRIWRYTDVLVTRVPNIPSHMVLDRERGWLYFIDGGSKTLKRLNVNSGAETGNLNVPATSNEPLASYKRVEGATVETVDTWTTQPCGVAYADGRILVGDNTNGNIHVYDVTGTPDHLGTITTGQVGMMGLEIGPDGRIWFVNHNANKVVRIDVAAVANDAAVSRIVAPVTVTTTPDYFSLIANVCEGQVAPTVELTNAGSNTLTTVEIHYTVDEGSVHTQPWSGSLAAGASANVVLPGVAVATGAHELKVWTAQPNGQADPNAHNDLYAGSFRSIDPVQSLPFFEGFTSTQFPPAGWNYVHFNPNNEMTRATVGGFGNSTGSLRMDNYSGDMNIAGQVDHLMTPRLDLSPLPVDGTLDFSLAHARYNTQSVDRLVIKVSLDCGGTWQTVFDEEGAGLSSANAQTSAFTPNSTQWRTFNVPMGAFAGEPDVMILFQNISDFGNNLYIDDIEIGVAGVGMAEASTTPIRVQPVPSNGTITVSMPGDVRGPVQAYVLALDGKCVYQEQWSGAAVQTLDLAALAKGSYVLRLLLPEGVEHRTRLVLE